jgi:putative peptidoglycan lipid II flippase
MATLAEPLIATLFHYGAFDAPTSPHPSAPDGLQRGPAGLHPGEDPGAGLLRAPGRPTPVRIAVGVLVVTQLLNLVFVP